MEFFAMLKSLREQINRDDGSFFQVGNRPVSTFEAIGLLSMVIGLALWQFHEKAGVDIFWALGFGSGGGLMYMLHTCRKCALR